MGKPKSVRLQAPPASPLPPSSALRRRGRRAQTVLALRERPLDIPGRCRTARGTRAASAERIMPRKHDRTPKNDVILSGGAAAPESKDLAATTQALGMRLLGFILSALLAITLIPATGLQAAFAAESAVRPETTGGDVALEGSAAEAAAESVEAQAGDTATPTPVAVQREDGMLVADGLMYTVADGGLVLIGFDGAAPKGVLSIPDAIMTDGEEALVVAVDLAESHVADQVVALVLSQSVKNINTSTLASAFPNLLSIEVASASGSSLPVAAGAASVRATYSTSGGMLFQPTMVTTQVEDGSIETIECKELVWAPPAIVSARIPVECRAIAKGAFADARDLKTIVAFGTMKRIADNAFSADQMENAKVVVPASSPVVVDEGAERVSANMALMGDVGQKERRRAWYEAGWRSDDIVMGKPCGSLTETVAVNADGAVERTDLKLISYPGMHPEATDVKHPGEDGKIDMAENGLAFTVKSDMTVSVAWQGDKTATPAHLEIPATITIDAVTYPVTEIAPRAFEGAAFLTSIAIPEGVTEIGDNAFGDCANLNQVAIPVTTTVASCMMGRKMSASSFLPDAGFQEGIDSAAIEGDVDRQASSWNKNNSADDGISAYAGLAYEAPGVAFKTTYGRPIALSDSSKNSFSLTDSGEYYILRYLGSETPTRVVVYLSGSTAKVTFHAGGTYLGAAEIGGGTSYVVVSVADAGVRRGNDIGITLGVVRREAVGTSSLLTSDSLDGYLKKTDAATLYQPKGSYAAASHNHDSSYYTKTLADSTFAKKTDIPSLSGYATQKWVTDKGYLTSSSLSPYLKTADADAKYQPKGSYAAASHTHDDRYYTESEADAKLDEKVDRSEFGTISYEGLGEGDRNTYPTSYRKGGMPSIHEPTREGYEFAGWSWSRGAVSGDGGNLGGAFSEAEDVTLTATWREVVPEANHFFSDGSPLTAGDGAEYQSHVIKVRLADFGGDALSRVAFERNDAAGILHDGAEVRLWVGSDPDVFANGTQLTLGETAATPAGWRTQLAQLADESWGVYVGVRIRTADVAADRIQTSYAAGSYVVSLVKMSYEFA